VLWRLPVGSGGESWPPISTEARSEYPTLEERFAILDEAVVPAFVEHDSNAIKAQTIHRRYRFALIVGVALTTSFGALQAAVNDAAWVGVVLAVLAAMTGAIANQERRSQPLRRHLTERAKAEELRSLYFAFLSGDRDQRALERDAAAIRYSEAEGTAP
jgi:hypothetical protein